jgi:hypothetical protein
MSMKSQMEMYSDIRYAITAAIDNMDQHQTFEEDVGMTEISDTVERITRNLCDIATAFRSTVESPKERFLDFFELFCAVSNTPELSQEEKRRIVMNLIRHFFELFGMDREIWMRAQARFERTYKPTVSFWASLHTGFFLPTRKFVEQDLSSESSRRYAAGIYGALPRDVAKRTASVATVSQRIGGIHPTKCSPPAIPAATPKDDGPECPICSKLWTTIQSKNGPGTVSTRCYSCGQALCLSCYKSIMDICISKACPFCALEFTTQ